MVDPSTKQPLSGAAAIWPAPAKLNLFLHITGRRDDGYHLLQTVFQLLDFGDELTFVPRQDGIIRIVGGIAGVAQQDNLIWRAARLLKNSAADHSDPCGADISVNKVLPMGGGLGGGSSNAATVLVALNKLWGLNYPLEKLASMGLDLGADVPVFVLGYSAWGEGVGEILQPVSLPNSWYVVIHPGVHVSTEELFGHSELTRDCTPITIAGFCSGSATRNVFQELVCEQQPKVAEVLKRLLDHCQQKDGQQQDGGGSDNLANTPRLTGTGSCVFVACRDECEAQNVLRAMTQGVTDDSVTGFVARGVNRSPLLSMV